MKFLKFILILTSAFSLFTKAQTLDKSYYLIDGIDKSKVNKNDMQIIDESLKKFHNSTSDTIKLHALENIVENCYDESIWTRYNILLLNLSRELQKHPKENEIYSYRSSEALAINNIGYYYFNYTKYQDSALYYFGKSQLINDEIKNIGNLIVNYSNIANIYQNRGEYTKAIELYNKVLDLEKEATLKTGVFSALNNLANIYIALGDSSTALDNLQKCFILANKYKNDDIKAHLLHNIGMLRIKNGDLNKGFQSLKTSLNIRRRLGDKKGIATVLLSMSSVMNLKNDVPLALQYLNEAKPLVDEVNNEGQIAIYYRNLGEALDAKGDYIGAIENYLKAIDVFEKSGNFSDLVETLKGAIVLCNKNPLYRQTKLELIEKLYSYGKIVDKNEAQRNMLKIKYDNELKIKEAEYKAVQEIKDEKARSEKKIQRNISITISVVLLMALIFSYFIFKALKQNNEKTVEISEQKHLVEEKQKEIIDSINYAKRIQNSFLPSEDEFNEAFPGSFIIYKPKDIVSGDFYWMIDSNNYTTVKRNFKGVAVADCTGHGVPGAILSMLGSSILNQAILDKEVMSSADLLDFLNSELKKNLKSKSTEIIRDGMDISCCIIFNDTLQMQFSGANNPCWILRDKEIIELKADKQAVTAAIEKYSKPFKLTEFQLQKNDQLFLFTDGYADQFGGPKGKKYKYAQLKSAIIESSELTPAQQKSHLLQSFNNWKGNLDQVDDVCIIGIRI